MTDHPDELGSAGFSLRSMAELVERFPLFPLGLVLLPQEVAPLHIFEERYKAMIGQCLEHGDEFGVLWLSDDGLREVGCAARIPRLLERLEDGRMNILVEGTRPFRLLRRVDDLAYPAGDVELLDEEHEGEEIDSEVGAAARERYADLVERATDTRPPEADLVALGAYEMVASVDVPLDAKQELLELRAEAERLRRIEGLFEETLNALDYAERAGELARSNGRARPGRV
jgi:Lon protease-like protein